MVWRVCNDNLANAYSMIKTTRFVSAGDTLTMWLGGRTFSLPRSGQYPTPPRAGLEEPAQTH